MVVVVVVGVGYHHGQLHLYYQQLQRPTTTPLTPNTTPTHPTPTYSHQEDTSRRQHNQLVVAVLVTYHNKTLRSLCEPYQSYLLLPRPLLYLHNTIVGAATPRRLPLSEKKTRPSL